MSRWNDAMQSQYDMMEDIRWDTRFDDELELSENYMIKNLFKSGKTAEEISTMLDIYQPDIEEVLGLSDE